MDLSVLSKTEAGKKLLDEAKKIETAKRKAVSGLDKDVTWNDGEQEEDVEEDDVEELEDIE